MFHEVRASSEGKWGMAGHSFREEDFKWNFIRKGKTGTRPIILRLPQPFSLLVGHCTSAHLAILATDSHLDLATPGSGWL